MSDSGEQRDYGTPKSGQSTQSEVQLMRKEMEKMRETMNELARGRREISPPRKRARADSVGSDRPQSPYEREELQLYADSDEELGREEERKTDLLDECLKETAPQSLGPAVGERLAEVIGTRFGARALHDKAKEKMEAMKRPENCPTLVTPKINNELFVGLAPNSKKQDWRAVSVQKGIAAAACGIAVATEELLKVKGNPFAEKAGKTLMNVMSVLGKTHQDMTQWRRDLLKPALKQDYSSMCTAPDRPSDDLLFGEDLTKRQKELEAANKLGRITKTSGYHQQGRHGSRGRGQPQYSYRRSDRGPSREYRGPFLAQGAKHRVPPWQRGGNYSNNTAVKRK